MVFNTVFPIIVLGILVVWTSVLTVFFFGMKKHYDRLIGKDTSATLKDVLERLLSAQSELDARMDDMDAQLGELKIDGWSHFQKLGIVRFNPFADTGGAQSFTLAFLDGKNSGFVMTSLFARTGNRWYIKQVIQGKGDEVPLSKEEQLAVSSAKMIRYGIRGDGKDKKKKENEEEK